MQAHVRRKLRYEGKPVAKHHSSQHVARFCARFLRGSLLGLQCVATLFSMRELSGLASGARILAWGSGNIKQRRGLECWSSGYRSTGRFL